MKKYKVIYADPPWEVKAGPGNLHIPGQKSRPLVYPTMSVDEIMRLPVEDIVEQDAVLFLWTINKYVEQAYAVCRAWGFKPSTMLVWCKAPKGRGLGGTFGISTEFLLFGRKGSLKAIDRVPSTWFQAKRGKHSEKPETVRELITTCFDAKPRIELFARQKVDGWDVWGNEVESDIQLGRKT